MRRNYLLEIKKIASKVRVNNPDFNEEKFIQAFKYSEKAHKGQLRKDGTEYISHLVETARILSDLRVDEDTLIASLLHDISEDTPITINDVQNAFGEHVAFLVNGVTKLSKVYYKHEMEKRQIESLKKLLLHTSKDPRVIFIKLADRLHNMRTIGFVKPEKQARISKETLEVYVPIANLMGIQDIKTELEDLCFKNLFPKEYEVFFKKVSDSEAGLKDMTEKIIDTIQSQLKKNRIQAEISIRKKSIFTIFKKIRSLGKTVDDVFDLITIRVIVNNVENCYKALGAIHGLFKPDLGRFKDYIAVPKINGYQSIHTTVFSKEGVPVEFQLRTKKTHDDSEYGIDLTKMKTIPARLMNWMEQILELQKDEPDIDYFMKDLKEEIFSDRITVLDLKGESVYLPADSSVLDYLFITAPEKVHYIDDVRVNDRTAQLTSTLKWNDKIKYSIGETKHDYRLEWLPFVKTNLARTKIREYFRNRSKPEKITLGKKVLQNAFGIGGLGFVEDVNFKKLKDLLSRKANFYVENLYDVYAAVGDGSIYPFDIIELIVADKYNAKKKSDVQLPHIPIGSRTIRLGIIGKNKPGLLNDVTDLLRQYNVNISKIKGGSNLWNKKGFIIVDFEMKDIELFTNMIKKLEQIPGVESVRRQFIGQFFAFLLFSIFTMAAWIAHPLIINELIESKTLEEMPILSDILIYSGLATIFILAIYLKSLSEKNFPGLRKAQIIWGMTIYTLALASAMIIGEIYYFHLKVDGILMGVAMALILIYLVLTYKEYAKVKLPKK